VTKDLHSWTARVPSGCWERRIVLTSLRLLSPLGCQYVECLSFRVILLLFELYESPTLLSHSFFTHPSMCVDHSYFCLSCQPFAECFYVCCHATLCVSCLLSYNVCVCVFMRSVRSECHFEYRLVQLVSCVLSIDLESGVSLLMSYSVTVVVFCPHTWCCGYWKEGSTYRNEHNGCNRFWLRCVYKCTQQDFRLT
jgi:hypothetical protein